MRSFSNDTNVVVIYLKQIMLLTLEFVRFFFFFLSVQYCNTDFFFPFRFLLILWWNYTHTYVSPRQIYQILLTVYYILFPCFIINKKVELHVTY